MATKAKKQAAALPAGFTAARTGNFPDEHDFKREPVLQGKVTLIREVEFTRKKGGKVVKEKRRIAEVANADGVVTGVWESASLRGLFDEMKPGDEIFVRLLGMKKIPGKPQPMKDFLAGIKPKAGKSKR